MATHESITRETRPQTTLDREKENGMRRDLVGTNILWAISIFFILTSHVFGEEPIKGWHLRTPLSLHSVAHGGNIFVVVGENGTILTSRNGEAWGLKTLRTGRPIRSVCRKSRKAR